jgi:cohesin loading factor subunit SCC2
LFALQGDIDNLPIRSLALTLLMVEGERRPDILRQRICAGVKLAYEMQSNLYEEKRDVTALVTIKRAGRQNQEIECIFSSIFKECIIHHRKLRQGLYRNLLGLFETDDTSNDESITVSGRQLFLGTKVDHQTKDLSLLSFVAQVLAHLPYNVVNDPLFIVHHIGSIITLQGQQCIERFSSFLQPFGMSGNDDLDETNMSEDALERAAASKFPSRTLGASILESKDFDLLEFFYLCHESAALCLLLRLKSFLCTNYHLSLTRCLEYDPFAKERLCDKGALRVNITKPFDASLAEALMYTSEKTKGSNSEQKNIDKDALVRQYAEFRARMREEQSLVPDDDSCGKSDVEELANGEEVDPEDESLGEDLVDESINVQVTEKRGNNRFTRAKSSKPPGKGRGRRSKS